MEHKEEKVIPNPNVYCQQIFEIEMTKGMKKDQEKIEEHFEELGNMDLSTLAS